MRLLQRCSSVVCCTSLRCPPYLLRALLATATPTPSRPPPLHLHLLLLPCITSPYPLQARIHSPSQPASPNRRARSRLPAAPIVHQAYPTTEPTLLGLASLPSLPPARAHPGSLPTLVARRPATSCALLGNFPRTSCCGTCSPRADRALDDAGPQCAGQTEYQSLDELPVSTHRATATCLSSCCLNRPKDEPENAHSLNSQSPALSQTQCIHCVLLSLLPCMSLLPLLLDTKQGLSTYRFHVLTRTSSVHQVPALASQSSVSPWPPTTTTVPRPQIAASTRPLPRPLTLLRPATQ